MSTLHLALSFSLGHLTHINHIYNDDGVRLNIDKLLHLDPTIWKPSVSNELGRLADGVRDVKGNKAIEFVSKSSIPKKNKVTYSNAHVVSRRLGFLFQLTRS